MTDPKKCVDCETGFDALDRRTFLKAAGTAAVVSAAAPVFAQDAVSSSQGNAQVRMETGN